MIGTRLVVEDSTYTHSTARRHNAVTIVTLFRYTVYSIYATVSYNVGVALCGR